MIAIGIRRHALYVMLSVSGNCTAANQGGEISIVQWLHLELSSRTDRCHYGGRPAHAAWALFPDNRIKVMGPPMLTSFH